MRFKIKTVAGRDSAADDGLLMKLIEWGKAPGEPAGPESAPGAERQERAGYSPDQLEKLSKLRVSIEELMKSRAEMLKRMEQRMEAEKGQLAQMTQEGSGEPTAQQVEAEVMYLADEMADLTMIQAHMEALSDEISDIIESFGIAGVARERGLAARALRAKLEAREKEVEELKSREEQLANREEMVDRKIKAYALKKKQLEDTESSLRSRLEKLEGERTELERVRKDALDADTYAEKEKVKEEWRTEQVRLRERVLGLKSVISPAISDDEHTARQIEDAEISLDHSISALEAEIRDLVTKKAGMEQKIADATAWEQDLGRLMKLLDQLLGQLPDEVIDKFSKSEDFALYEKVLDRLKI
jgi:DNA repair exonuclease SbcCD ATPase subunit